MGNNPVATFAGDLNGDADPEAVVADAILGFFVVLGVLGGNSQPSSVPAGPSPVDARPINLNGDALQDVVVANSNGTVSLFQSTNSAPGAGRVGAQAFGFTRTDIVCGTVGPTKLVVGDFNKDGRDDIAVAGCHAPAAAATPIRTNTAVPVATATGVPATSTSTSAAATLTATGIPATATSVPATATVVPSTATSVAATATNTAQPGAATPTSTPQTPTATRSATPSATAGPPQIGGRAFSISPRNGVVQLAWQGGNQQTGYMVARLAGGLLTFIPAAGLPAGATSFTDQTPLAGLNCYALLPQGTSPQAYSDILCAMVGFGTTTGAPQTFTLKLNQASTASFAWTAPQGAGQDRYLLATFGGATTPLSGAATSAAIQINGLTCYALGALNGGLLLGYTDQVCGLPGFSNLGP